MELHTYGRRQVDTIDGILHSTYTVWVGLGFTVQCHSLHNHAYSMYELHFNLMIYIPKVSVSSHFTLLIVHLAYVHSEGGQSVLYIIYLLF